MAPSSASGGEPAGTVVKTAVPSAALGRDIACNIYLPAGYAADDSARYIVLYLLHGRGDTLDAWLEIKPDLDRLIAAKEIPPVIAVMPDAPSSRRAGYYIDSLFMGRPDDPALPPGEAVETGLTKDLIAAVDARYRTRADRSGRIIAGYSMGGYGALRLALAYPGLFGAAIVLSPAVYVPLPPRHSSAREFGAFGNGPALFDDAVYRERNYPALLPPFATRILALSIFIAVGDDEYVHPEPGEHLHDLDYEAHTLYNRLRREPLINAQLRVLNGGHGWGVWRPGFVAGLCHLLGARGGIGATDARVREQGPVSFGIRQPGAKRPPSACWLAWRSGEHSHAAGLL